MGTFNCIKYLYAEGNLHKLILYIHHKYFCNGHGIYNLLNICKEKYKYQVIFQSDINPCFF
jgi:hypothetical protein